MKGRQSPRRRVRQRPLQLTGLWHSTTQTRIGIGGEKVAVPRLGRSISGTARQVYDDDARDTHGVIKKSPTPPNAHIAGGRRRQRPREGTLVGGYVRWSRVTPSMHATRACHVCSAHHPVSSGAPRHALAVPAMCPVHRTALVSHTARPPGSISCAVAEAPNPLQELFRSQRYVCISLVSLGLQRGPTAWAKRRGRRGCCIVVVEGRSKIPINPILNLLDFT